MPRSGRRVAATFVALVSAVAFLAGGAATGPVQAAASAATTRAASAPTGGAARTSPVVLNGHASHHGDTVAAGGPAAVLPDVHLLSAPVRAAGAQARSRTPHERTVRTTTDGRAPPA